MIVSHLQVYAFAEKYFGNWKPNTLGSQSIKEVEKATVLPRERRFEQAATAGPLLLKAFYRDPGSSRDSVIIEVIA